MRTLNIKNVTEYKNTHTVVNRVLRVVNRVSKIQEDLCQSCKRETF